MTKAELIAIMAEEAGISKEQARKALGAYLKAVNKVYKAGSAIQYVKIHRPIRGASTGSLKVVKSTAGKTVKIKSCKSLQGKGRPDPPPRNRKS